MIERFLQLLNEPTLISLFGSSMVSTLSSALIVRYSRLLNVSVFKLKYPSSGVSFPLDMMVFNFGTISLWFKYIDISIIKDLQVPSVPASTSSEPQILNVSRLGQLVILIFFIFLNVRDLKAVSPSIENSDTAFPFSSSTPVILNSLIAVLVRLKSPATSWITKAFMVVNALAFAPLILRLSDVSNGLPAILMLLLVLTDDMFISIKLGKLENEP